MGDRGEPGLSVFRSEFIYALDEKGRVKLPPAFRELLSPKGSDTRIFLLRDVEPCIGIYPEAEYALLEAKVSRLDMGVMANRKLRRRFVSSVAECSVDAQGRILLPPSLMEYAQLVKSGPALFAGFGNYVQLWNKALYEDDIKDAPDMRSDGPHQLELIS